MIATRTTRFAAALLLLAAAGARAQQPSREPNIGYLFPAGGKQGTTVRVLAGGQNLGEPKRILLSGEGVSAKFIRFYKPFSNLDDAQRKLLDSMIKARRDQLVPPPPRKDGSSGPGKTGKSQPAQASNPPPPPKPAASPTPGASPTASPSPAASPVASGTSSATPSPTPAPTPVTLPAHPLIEEIPNMSLRQLENLLNVLVRYNPKAQTNMQLAEMVGIEITIAADAPPGDRELRFETPNGITAPIIFQVGTLPERFEQEPNDPGPPAVPANPPLPPEPAVDLPFALNGQIMPGDVDRFRFRARAGQQLVVDVRARQLIPYLADAVPGWFQAVVKLLAADGKELAYADDFRFSPDPVIAYKIPADGEYELEIHDSIYRGRQDFVYRVQVGETPFISAMFPLGAPSDKSVTAAIAGLNLPVNRLALDSKAGGPPIRQAALRLPGRFSNQVLFAVGDLPEAEEREPNDTNLKAEQLALPVVVNGRIGRPGDVDVFRFEGRADSEVVAEVYGRRLRSPVDSILRLTDANGKIITWNDDAKQAEKPKHLYTGPGLLTHHADACIRAKLPANGVYYLRMEDTQGAGGDAYAYRLRVSPPRPDFQIRAAPSAINVRAGNLVPVTVFASREDGFDGEIEIALDNPPPGFALCGNRIPAGQESVRFTLTAPEKSPGEAVPIRFVGKAVIGGREVIRPAAPADDKMQAFLYRHLVPAESQLVCVIGNRGRSPLAQITGAEPVRIPAGGTVAFVLKLPKGNSLRDAKPELNDPPPGLVIEEAKPSEEGIEVRLKADPKKAVVGAAGNLIVEMFPIPPAQTANAPVKPPSRNRSSLGILPAIPYLIVGS